MPSTAALELLIALKGDDEAAQGLDELGEKGGGMGDAVKNGALIAGGAIVGLGVALFGAAMEADKGQQKMDQLSRAVENSGAAYEGSSKDIDAHIASMQKMAFSDDESADSLKLLVTQTGSLQEAMTLQNDAANLARFGNIDLEKATRLLLKADDESYAALGKLGIQVDEHATKEQALAQIRAASAGASETYANSATGSLARMQDAMGEAFESIGGAVLPLISGPLQSLADWFQSPEVQAGIQSFATTVGDVLVGAFNAVMAAINFVMPIIQPFIDAWVGLFGAISSGGDVMTAFGELFNNFGQAFANAWAIIGPALGSLIGNIVQWIVDNGPTILATLLGWTQAFLSWVWNDALPALLEALGGLISMVWTWIIDNGPTILATLAEWTTAFFNWVWNDAIPKLLEALGGLIESVWNWIIENGPTILSTLGEWTSAFFNWIMDDVLPQLPGWLWNLVNAVWTFITENGPTILSTLGEWTSAFMSWVMDDVLPQVPTWLGNVAGALWTWITETAKSLGDKLINEWIPSFWNWLTGPGGVLENLPYFLNDIWTGFSEWVGTTAEDLLEAAVSMGEAIYNGILDGIAGLGEALWNFISGIAQGIWDSLVSFFTGGGGGGDLPSDPSHKGNVVTRGRGGVVIGGFGGMATSGGYGGGNVYVTINAGLVAGIDEIMEEIEYRLGDQVAIRSGSRGGHR